MKYTSTLIVVSDMEKSRQFYHDVLGMNVVADFGANVKYEIWLPIVRKGRIQ